MKQAIINFLSNRFNLTIFQCLLYFMIGWVMGQHLTWIELGIMYAIMLCIQFITRTKAVADGMMFREMMIDLDVDANEIVKRINSLEAEKIKKLEIVLPDTFEDTQSGLINTDDELYKIGEIKLVDEIKYKITDNENDIKVFKNIFNKIKMEEIYIYPFIPPSMPPDKYAVYRADGNEIVFRIVDGMIMQMSREKRLTKEEKIYIRKHIL